VSYWPRVVGLFEVEARFLSRGPSTLTEQSLLPLRRDQKGVAESKFKWEGAPAEQTRPADGMPLWVYICWRFPVLSNKLLLSLKEFSFLVGLSLRTTTKLVASREIKSIRVGRRRLIPRSELDQFAERDHQTSRQPESALRKKVGR
jgi:excisionase family DNA binding protein